MTDVFISYSRKDSSFVHRFHRELKDLGRETWVDWEDIAPTAEWMREIQSAIEGAESFVFVISPDSVASEICSIELDHAITHNKRIVPIVYRDVDHREMPDRLASLNWIFIREADDFQSGFKILLEAIDTNLDWVRVHTRLLVRAKEWESQDRDKSYLLRGRDLIEIEDWFSRRGDLEPHPTALQTQFAGASRKAATIRQRGIFGAVVGGLVIAIGLAVVALIQRNEAIRQAEVAESRQLVANAQQQLPINPDLSLRLILESATIRRTETTEQALREILSESRVRAVLEGYGRGVNSQAMSHDGQLVVKKDEADVVHIWHIDDSNSVGILPDCPTDITTVAFDPRGDLLSTGHSDGRLFIWGIGTGQKIREISANAAAVSNVAFNPVDATIAILSADGSTRVWSLETGKALQMIAGAAAKAQSNISFDPTGRMLIVERDYKRMVFRMPEAIPIREHEGFCSHDGNRWFVETCRSCDAQVQEANAGVIASGFGGAFGSSAVFSSDGRLLLRTGVCGGPAACDFVARIYDVDSGQLRRMLEGHSDIISMAAFSPDDRYIVTASADGTAKVWESGTWRLFATLIGHSGDVFSAAFSANGRHVITASRDGTARVWDAGTGVSQIQIQSDQESVSRAIFVNAGENIVTIDKDGGMRWWQAHSGAATPASQFDRPEVVSEEIKPVIERIRASGVMVTDFLESPNGKYLVTESTAYQNGDRKLRVWVVSTATQIAEIVPSDDLVAEVGILAITPDDRFMATTEYCSLTIDCDRIVHLREVMTGRPVRALRGHGNQIYQAAFSPSGKVIATSDGEGALRLWFVESGNLIAELPGHDSSAQIEFSSSGESLVTVGRRGKVLVYHCEACGSLRDLLERAGKRSVRDFTCQERRTYIDENIDCP